jgi:Gpi18-like mannosyltransferase
VREGNILDFYKFNLDDPLSIYVYGPVWMTTMIQYSWTNFTSPSDPWFWLFSRTPIIVADVLCFFLIYLIGERKDQALLGSAIYFLNPFTILVGSARGSFDSIGCCLLLLSIFLISRKSYLLGSLVLVLTMLTKPYFYFVVPLLLASMIRNEREGVLKIAKNSIFFFCLISAPFLLNTPTEYLDAILVRRKWGEARTYNLLRRPASGLWYIVYQHRKRIASLLGFPRLGSSFHLRIALEGGKRWAIYAFLVPLTLFALHNFLGETLTLFLLDDMVIATSIVIWLSLELIS